MAERETWCSWSQLKTYAACKQRLKLTREHKRADGGNVRVFLGGSVCDMAMRDWLNDPGREPGQMAARLEATMATEIDRVGAEEGGVVRWKHREDRRQLLAKCAHYLTRLEPLLDTLVVPYDFQPAYNFKVPLYLPDRDGRQRLVYLKGEMDVLVRYTETDWGVWDLKITENASYWKTTIGQIAFYALARDLLWPGTRTIRGGLIQPGCVKPLVEATLTEEAEIVLMGWILRYAQSIWAEELPMNETTAECDRCIVKHACPKFTPVGGGTRGIVPFSQAV